MKFTTAPQSLVEGLAIAASAAAVRTTKPALQGVLITARKDCVLLMATDLELGIRYNLTQVEVESEGQVLIPVGKLSQIARETNDATIVLELEENTLHVRGRDSHFSLYTGDVREFPPVPDLEGQADLILAGEVLRQLVERTLFAAAKESTRYAIDGMLWDGHGARLRVVATDGRRLAVAETALEKPVGSEIRAIVPAKAMNLIGRVVSDPQELFQIKFLSNQVLFKSPRVSVSSVLAEGHFPKYQDVIPQDCDRKMKVPVAEMLSAVRRAALLTSEESKAIRLRFENNKVIMTGRAPEQGQASVHLPLACGADLLEIGFNPNFLMDVLKVLNAEEVSFELKDANRPGVFRMGDDYLYVVMPVNLS